MQETVPGSSQEPGAGRGLSLKVQTPVAGLHWAEAGSWQFSAAGFARGVPAIQEPDWQVSAPLQRLASAQEVLSAIGIGRHSPQFPLAHCIWPVTQELEISAKLQAAVSPVRQKTGVPLPHFLPPAKGVPSGTLAC